MLINEFISSVFAGTNVSTDDAGISKRWIYHEAKVTRSELIKQELNKNRLLDGAQAQPLEDFKMSLTDISGGDKYNTYPILKSELKIPKLIQYDSGLALDGVYTKSGKVITFTDKQTWWNKKRRRFARPGEMYSFIDKGFLFIDGFEDVDDLEIDVIGHFDDPVAVGMMAKNDCDCCEKDNCKPAYEYDFQMPGHIERRTIEIVRSVVLRKLGIPVDVENNDKLDIQSNVSNKVQPTP